MSNHDRDLSPYFQPQRCDRFKLPLVGWMLFLLAASLPDQLEPATRKQSRFRSRRGLFHTYSVWILLGLTIFWMPTGTLTVSGIPVFNAGVKALVWVYLAGVLCHLVADTGSRQGCSILLPCNCGQLGYCRCHQTTFSRLA